MLNSGPVSELWAVQWVWGRDVINWLCMSSLRAFTKCYVMFWKLFTGAGIFRIHKTSATHLGKITRVLDAAGDYIVEARLAADGIVYGRNDRLDSTTLDVTLDFLVRWIFIGILEGWVNAKSEWLRTIKCRWNDDSKGDKASVESGTGGGFVAVIQRNDEQTGFDPELFYCWWSGIRPVISKWAAVAQIFVWMEIGKALSPNRKCLKRLPLARAVIVCFRKCPYWAGSIQRCA